MSVAVKRAAIAVKKDTIVDTFLSAGWKPNKEYLKQIRPFNQNTSINDRGQIIDSYFGHSPRVSDYHLLISPDKKYAVTVKEQVFTLHDGQRNFCKVLSFKHEDVEIKSDRLVSGMLEIRLQ